MLTDVRKDRIRRKEVLGFLDYRAILGGIYFMGKAGKRRKKPKNWEKIGGFRETA